jgi:hypothetical protein
VNLEAAFKRDLAKLPDGDATQNGVRLGQQVAEKHVEARKDDGVDDKVDYVASGEPIAWKPTPPAHLPPLQPHFGKVKPFFVKDALQFDPGPPLAVSSKQFVDELDEVRRLGGRDSKERTPDQTAVAIFWTAPSYVIFSAVARQVSDAKNLDLHDNCQTARNVDPPYCLT